MSSPINYNNPTVGCDQTQSQVFHCAYIQTHYLSNLGELTFKVSAFMNKFSSLFTIVLSYYFISPVFAQDVISEKIFFLNEDGEAYVRYDTTRTNSPSYDIWFGKENSLHPEKNLENYLYVYPDN